MSSSSPRRLMPISRPTPTVAAAVRSSAPKRPMTGRTRLTNPTTPTMRRRSPSSCSATPDCANQYSAEAGDYWLRIADGSGHVARLVARRQRGDGRDPDLPGEHDLPSRRLGDTGGVLVGERRRLVGRRRDERSPRTPCANVYESVAGDYWLRIADAAGLDLDELLELNDATADTPVVPGFRGVPAGRCQRSGGADHRSSGDRRAVDASEHRPGDDCGTGLHCAGNHRASGDHPGRDHRAAGAAGPRRDRTDHPRRVA